MNNRLIASLPGCRRLLAVGGPLHGNHVVSAEFPSRQNLVYLTDPKNILREVAYRVCHYQDRDVLLWAPGFRSQGQPQTILRVATWEPQSPTTVSGSLVCRSCGALFGEVSFPPTAFPLWQGLPASEVAALFPDLSESIDAHTCGEIAS